MPLLSCLTIVPETEPFVICESPEARAISERYPNHKLISKSNFNPSSSIELLPPNASATACGSASLSLRQETSNLNSGSLLHSFC